MSVQTTKGETVHLSISRGFVEDLTDEALGRMVKEVVEGMDAATLAGPPVGGHDEDDEDRGWRVVGDDGFGGDLT